MRIDNSQNQYGKIKLDKRSYENAVLRLNENFNPKHFKYSIKDIEEAISLNNLPLMREISEHFYLFNGIYARVIDYFAYMYRYDWYLATEIYNKEEYDEKQVVKNFNFLLKFLDNSQIKRLSGKIALEVIKAGAYYGYIVPSKKGLVLQQLPVNYCRSLYQSNNMPVVEFNMKYFDDAFKDISYRMKMLNMFPEEFKKGYLLYKQGKLPADNIKYWNRGYKGIGQSGWYALPIGSAVRFAMNENEHPLFIKAIPEVLDLKGSQNIDKQKQLQNLQKILIQQLPLDKNYDLVFDVEEARDIHENAREMLGDNIGVDVITTFAQIKSADISDGSMAQSTDVLERMERGAYNAFGVSHNLFNSETSLALEKSILNDESSFRGLLLQLSDFFNYVVNTLVSKPKYGFRFYMLETTQYNYKEMARMYKEQMQFGNSKVLPQVALGHSQSSVLHNAYFENNVLHLSEIMIPPLMSSTMNAETLGMVRENDGSENQNNTEGNIGRPEKADSEKSEKTAANLESM